MLAWANIKAANVLFLVSPQPVLTGPDLAYIDSSATFWCHWPDSSPPIMYKLLRDGIPVGMDIVYKGNRSVSFVLRVTATSEGRYLCQAGGKTPTGLSNSIHLSVVSECNHLPTTSDPLPGP